MHIIILSIASHISFILMQPYMCFILQTYLMINFLRSILMRRHHISTRLSIKTSILSMTSSQIPHVAFRLTRKINFIFSTVITTICCLMYVVNLRIPITFFLWIVYYHYTRHFLHRYTDLNHRFALNNM